jgi:hypothetical protein
VGPVLSVAKAKKKAKGGRDPSTVDELRALVDRECLVRERQWFIRDRKRRSQRDLLAFSEARETMLASKYFFAILKALIGERDAIPKATDILWTLTAEHFRPRETRSITPRAHKAAQAKLEADKKDALRALYRVKALVIKDRPLAGSSRRSMLVWADHSFSAQLDRVIFKAENEHPARWLEAAYQLELWGEGFEDHDAQGGASSRPAAVARWLNAALPTRWPEGVVNRITAIYGMVKMAGHDIERKHIASALRFKAHFSNKIG